jgi:hypothetical protein
VLAFIQLQLSVYSYLLLPSSFRSKILPPNYHTASAFMALPMYFHLEADVLPGMASFAHPSQYEQV